MENWLYAFTPVLITTLLSMLVIFITIIFLTRLAGLRTFAKMSSFDFASTIAIGSILAAVVMNSNQSLLKGGLALAGIIAFQYFFSYVVRKSDIAKKYFTNKPMILMYKGEIIEKNLNKTNVGRDNLIAKLREANVMDFNEVEAVVLESTGDISVLHTSDSELNEALLEGVEGFTS